jgi:hypothetical protein
MRGRRRQGSLDRAYLELGTPAKLAEELSAEEEMTLSRELRVLQRNTAKFIQILKALGRFSASVHRQGRRR